MVQCIQLKVQRRATDDKTATKSGAGIIIARREQYIKSNPNIYTRKHIQRNANESKRARLWAGYVPARVLSLFRAEHIQKLRPLPMPETHC